MKIFIDYETTEDPWGGINSFLRSLKEYFISKKDIILVNSINESPDIVLISAASAGVDKEISVNEVREWVNSNKRTFKLIHRLDGLRAIYNNELIPNDLVQIELMKLSDHIIFQSNASLENFRKFNYDKDNYTIIYNGVNQNVYNLRNKHFYKKTNKLKVLSVSWSTSINKGFETIARFSELPNLESYFVGRWNNEVDKKNVKIIPPKKNFELAKLYKDCDIFLHAAQNDPCPNVVLEALSCGLPVIYSNSGGTPELASEYGVPIPEDLTEFEQTINIIEDKYNKFIEKININHHWFSIERAAEQYLKVFREKL